MLSLSLRHVLGQILKIHLGEHGCLVLRHDLPVVRAA